MLNWKFSEFQLNWSLLTRLKCLLKVVFWKFFCYVVWKHIICTSNSSLGLNQSFVKRNLRHQNSFTLDICCRLLSPFFCLSVQNILMSQINNKCIYLYIILAFLCRSICKHFFQYFIVPLCSNSLALYVAVSATYFVFQHWITLHVLFK